MHTYICGNERTHFFRKIYLAHFIRERVVRGELETELTATYWPQVPLFLAALLSHSAVLLNRGSWGPKFSAGSCFSLPQTATRANWLQLTRTVCGTGSYNCLTYTCSLWASHLHRIQPIHMLRLYLDVFDRMHLFLDWCLGRRLICYRGILLLCRDVFCVLYSSSHRINVT